MRPDGADTLKTRQTLLSKVRRGDEEGWSRFYDLYQDFIYSAGRGAGLSHEESRDVVQESMISVRNYVNKFIPDETRGRFRTWLRRIVQSRIADQYRKRKRNPLERAAIVPLPEDSATSATNRIPDLNPAELDRLIDGKLEEAIMAEARRLAKEKVRSEDYQAYDFFGIQGMKACDVAVSLNISSATVRVRALRVRRVIEREIGRIIKVMNQKSAEADGKRRAR
jgi:RNA polymerase sigma-70 factor (ECF subfamily)